MRRMATIGTLILLALGVIGVAGSLESPAAPPKTFQSQVAHTFVNGESVAVHGLQVVLSGAADVKLDDDTGRAGPFRDVRGNGTGTIVLTNPEAPVEPGAGAFDLVFRSYGKKLAVKSWWWLDAKGKRVGQKHKG